MNKAVRHFALLATVFAATSGFAADGKTKGPHGETPTPAGTLVLTAAEEEQIRGGNFTAALVWHEMSEYTNAVNSGARDEFKRLGIEVVARRPTRASMPHGRSPTSKRYLPGNHRLSCRCRSIRQPPPSSTIRRALPV